MGLGGPNLVKGATGQTVDAETLGGAMMHTEVSGVAHYAVDDDAECLAKIRESGRDAAEAARGNVAGHDRDTARRSADDVSCTICCPPIIACPTTCTRFSSASSTPVRSTSSSTISRSEMICADARIDGHPGRRHRQPARARSKDAPGEKPRFGGIIYAESAEKVGVLHRPLQPRAHPDPLRAGRVGFHGRTGGRARGDHPRRRALRRGDGDRACPRRSCSR